MLEALTATLGLALLAVFGWAFKLNSKVNVQGQRYDDLLTLIDARFDIVVEKLDAATKVAVGTAKLADDRTSNYNYRLERIERALNGSLHRD